MRKTADIVAPLLLIAGLAACGRQAVEAGRSPVDAARRASAPVTGAFAVAVQEASPADSPAAIGSALRLKRGYYVASDTPCNKASNATVSLLQRGGIGGARDFCEFKKVEQTGPNTYRVTQACHAFQDSGPAEVSVVTYALSGDASFTSLSDHGWEYSARHCSQSSMPDEWRQNDIRQAAG